MEISAAHTQKHTNRHTAAHWLLHMDFLLVFSLFPKMMSRIKQLSMEETGSVSYQREVKTRIIILYNKCMFSYIKSSNLGNQQIDPSY